MKGNAETWREYIYDNSDGKEEIKSKQPAFVDYLVEEVESALHASHELDAEKFDVEPDDRWLCVTAAGWMMDELEDVVRVRDALQDEGVGDDSVGVYGYPWSHEDEGPTPYLPPVMDEYTVQVQLHREVEIFKSAVDRAQI